MHGAMSVILSLLHERVPKYHKSQFISKKRHASELKDPSIWRCVKHVAEYAIRFQGVSRSVPLL